MKFAVNSSKPVTLSLSARRWHFRQSRPARSPFRIPTVRWSSSSRRRRPRPVSLHSKNIILKIPPTFLWRLCKHSFTVKRESAAEQACAAAMANWGGLGAAWQSMEKNHRIKAKTPENFNNSEWNDKLQRETPGLRNMNQLGQTRLSFRLPVLYIIIIIITSLLLVWFGLEKFSAFQNFTCTAGPDAEVAVVLLLQMTLFAHPKIPGSNIKFHLHRSNNWDFSTCRRDGAI